MHTRFQQGGMKEWVDLFLMKPLQVTTNFHHEVGTRQAQAETYPKYTHVGYVRFPGTPAMSARTGTTRWARTCSRRA